MRNLFAGPFSIASVLGANNPIPHALGCYVIHNELADKYYVGQSCDIGKRVVDHFVGYGNRAVRDDYTNAVENGLGHLFSVMYVELKQTGFDRIEQLETSLMLLFDSLSNGYNEIVSDAEFQPMIRNLSDQFGTSDELCVRQITGVTSCDEETVNHILGRLFEVIAHRAPFIKNPSDFGNGVYDLDQMTSVYEYYYLLHIKKIFDGIMSAPLGIPRSPDETKRIAEEYPEIPILQRTYRYTTTDDNPCFSLSEQAWIIWQVSEQVIPKRDRHNTNVDGWPWLYYLTKCMMERRGRAKKLLNAIEQATGRTISGKESEEVQQAFGAVLS